MGRAAPVLLASGILLTVGATLATPPVDPYAAVAVFGLGLLATAIGSTMLALAAIASWRRGEDRDAARRRRFGSTVAAVLLGGLSTAWFVRGTDMPTWALAFGVFIAATAACSVALALAPRRRDTT